MDQQCLPGARILQPSWTHHQTAAVVPVAVRLAGPAPAAGWIRIAGNSPAPVPALVPVLPGVPLIRDFRMSHDSPPVVRRQVLPVLQFD